MTWNTPNLRLAIAFLLLGPGLGLLLGPWGLGKVSPQAYDALFVDTGDLPVLKQAKKDLADYKREQPVKNDRELAQLRATGVTEAAVEEIKNDLADEFSAGTKDRESRVQAALKILLSRHRAHDVRMGTIISSCLTLFWLCVLARFFLPVERALERNLRDCLNVIGSCFFFLAIGGGFAAAPNPIIALFVLAAFLAAVGLIYLFWKAVIALIDRIRSQ